MLGIKWMKETVIFVDSHHESYKGKESDENYYNASLLLDVYHTVKNTERVVK